MSVSSKESNFEMEAVQLVLLSSRIADSSVGSRGVVNEALTYVADTTVKGGATDQTVEGDRGCLSRVEERAVSTFTTRAIEGPHRSWSLAQIFATLHEAFPYLQQAMMHSGRQTDLLYRRFIQMKSCLNHMVGCRPANDCSRW